MTVYQAGKIARDQVMQQAGEIPGFDGAFFHGSINELPANASLPENSDVDIAIISEKLKPEFSGKLIRDGLILDVSRLGRGQLGSAEEILGQYHLAGSFRNPILSLMFPETLPGCKRKYPVVLQEVIGSGNVVRMRQNGCIGFSNNRMNPFYCRAR